MKLHNKYSIMVYIGTDFPRFYKGFKCLKSAITSADVKIKAGAKLVEIMYDHYADSIYITEREIVKSIFA